MNYRKIWSDANGEIPVDEDGFSYEIHHIDGDHNNNDLVNLQLVSIREHLQIHLNQQDWFAAALIAKRLGRGSNYISELQRGKKRPGIGGVKKGNVPWNKDKKGCFSEKTISKFKQTRKGKRYGIVKITDEQCLRIVELYKLQEPIQDVGTKMGNGKTLTYERAFAKKYCKEYGVTEVQIYNIITGRRNVQDQ